jgi:hypothetical protein
MICAVCKYGKHEPALRIFDLPWSSVYGELLCPLCAQWFSILLVQRITQTLKRIR